MRLVTLPATRASPRFPDATLQNAGRRNRVPAGKTRSKCDRRTSRRCSGSRTVIATVAPSSRTTRPRLWKMVQRSGSERWAVRLRTEDRRFDLRRRRGRGSTLARTATWGGTAAVPPPVASVRGAPRDFRGPSGRRVRGASACGMGAETRLDREAAAARRRRSGPVGALGEHGSRLGDGSGGAALGRGGMRGGEVVEDAADDAGLGDEGDHAHHAAAAGTDERIDFVHPANEPGPSPAKGGQGWGHRGERQGRLRGRAGGGRLCFPGLAAGLLLAADDVGVGAVVMDDTAMRTRTFLLTFMLSS